MQQAIISDTSCLIVLTKIEKLDILKGLFGEVIITPAIAKEYQLPLPEWIKVRAVENLEYQH